jgi:hypothetical protein
MYPHTIAIALLYSLPIPPTSATPLYVFSQVISLPADTSVLVDTDFIRRAEKMIQEQVDREQDDDMREQSRQDVWSSNSSPLVSQSEDDSSLPIIILSIVGSVLGGTIAVLVRVVIQNYRGDTDKTLETDRNEFMKQKLARLREMSEARDLMDYFGAERGGQGRTENVYVSRSVMV